LPSCHHNPAYYVSAISNQILATGSHAQGSIRPCCRCHHPCHCLCEPQTCNSRLQDFSFLLQVSHFVFRCCEPKSKQSRLALLLVIPVLLSIPIAYTGRSLYSAVPLAFATYTGALILFTLAYRLSPSHPLAKYPGPVIAKTSKWWAAYISARGDSHRYYKYLHDIYGDVVRIGRGRRLLFLIYPLTHRQDPTSSQFAMLPSFTPFLEKAACRKDQCVHLYHLHHGRSPATCDD